MQTSETNSEKNKMTYIDSHKYPRTQGKPDLAGRVQPVKIERFVSDANAVGRVDDGDTVLVTNGRFNTNLGGWCLVRFDLVPGTTRGNFINSSAPFNIQGLDPDRYLFYGTWAPWMNKAGMFPTFQEADRCYNPGRYNWIVYFSKLYGPAVIYGNKPPMSLKGDSYHRMITKYLPNPLIASRLVIGELSEEEAKEGRVSKELGEFLDAAAEHEISPIRLDNLAHNRMILRRRASFSVPQQAQQIQQEQKP